MVYAEPGELDAFTQGDPATLLARAEGAVNDHVGRPLAEAEYTETFVLGGRRLWLVAPGWPATVTAVVEDDVALTPDDYTLTEDGALDREGGSWGDPVTVTYTTGFLAGSPQLETAKRVVLQLAAMAAANPQGLDSIALDGATPSFVVRDNNLALPPLSLSQTQKDELDRFKWRRRWA